MKAGTSVISVDTSHGLPLLSFCSSTGTCGMDRRQNTYIMDKDFKGEYPIMMPLQ